MRLVLILALLGLLACGDPGLRDRSLMTQANDAGSFNPYALGNKKSGGPTSVIGLAPDPLAQYYPEDAALVVRCKDLNAFSGEVAEQVARVRAALPGLPLPAGDPTELLRRMLKLPEAVLIDPVRPFAFVKVKLGWVGILPTRSKDKAPTRLKQLDAVYCVAGEPGIGAAYRAGFRKGFYLPGDVSVMADAETFRTLGSELTALLAPLAVDLSALDAWLPPVPDDIKRVDVGARLQQGALRVDLRAAPGRDSPTAVYLERMRPVPPGAVRWLPPRGTAYVEFTNPPLDWEGLVSVLFRDQLQPPTGGAEQLLFSVRRFLAALGQDAAAVLELEPDRAGTILLVAQLEKPDASTAFFESVDHAELLRAIAGPDGELTWKPDAFSYRGIQVGMITGNVSRPRLIEWRQSGSFLLTTLSVLLRGPAVAYVAVAGDKLCVLVGQKAREDFETVLEHVLRGRPVDNDHNVEVVSLFPQRLAAASVDLAALYNGLRDAAPYWHENGRTLRDLQLRLKIPAAVAVTVEGGALRIAVRVPPPVVAETAARIRDRLSR